MTSLEPGAAGPSVDDVLRALELDRRGAGHWLGTCAPAEGPVVFGGQLIGQAIVAAAGEVADKRVSSVHTTFARTGRPGQPVAFDIDLLHEGRSFASLSVTALQGERQLARSLVLLDAGDEDVIRHAAPVPAVKSPDGAIRQRTQLDGWEQRFAEDVDLFDPGAVGPPELAIWSRFRTQRREPALAQALLAWASVGSFIGTAMRPHPGVGLSQAHRTLSTGVLSHTLSFHQEFPAGDWQLFVLRSTFAGGGRAFGTGQVFSADGHLVASCAQEAMIRRMAAPGRQLLVPAAAHVTVQNEGGQPRAAAGSRRVPDALPKGEETGMTPDIFELRYTDFSLAGDELAVREAFREFFTEQCPANRVRASEPLGFDARLWRQAAELGAATMGLPESLGGDGAGLLVLVIVAEEAGAVLAPVPFAEHTAASRAAARFAAGAAGAGPARARDALLSVAERPLTLMPQPVTALMSALAPAGAVARDVLALDGDELILLHAQEPPPLMPNQGSTPLAQWAVREGVSRTVIASGGDAVTGYATACAEWRLLTAAALVGLTRAALGLAVEFSKSRETMGVPIGSLQGVAFPLVDVEIGVSGARNLVRKAAWLADNEPGEHPGLSEAAFAYAAQVATHGATTAAHIQGGLGFTVEADASLYFLRAKGWSVLGGDPARAVRAVGDALIARVLSK